MNPAELIVRTLDRHLSGPGTIRLLGGAALILGYGRARATEDADLLMEDEELRLLAEQAGLGPALEATNAELEAHGLYLSHIWGPEHQILTSAWRARCRSVDFDPPLERLAVEVLGPLDLVLSKMCRADEGDLADIAWLLQRERLAPDAVRAAIRSAVVPSAFEEVFPESVRRVEALLRT